jgi:Esterase/lipase
MKAQEIILNESRNVTLTAYLQEVEGEFGFSKRPAMLVIPGGGYAMCSDREADPVAMAYLKAGYQAFVLRYTCTPKGKWPLPLMDYEQAMALIEENAEAWHIDTTKIAVVGFSAGGHLAACAATVAEHKPVAAVLVYPAILKDICDMCQPGMPYPHEHVTSDTCPCFLVAARDDRTVDISNTLRMELALAEKGISFESHIYSYGGHGFSTGEDWINTNSVCPRLSHWVPDSIEWLGEVMGKLTRSGFTEPTAAISMNGNFAPVLSVSCTLSHLRRQNEEAKTVLAPMFAAIEAVAKARQFSVEGLMAAVGNNTAREIMEMVQIPSDAITEIDKALHQMVNQLED